MAQELVPKQQLTPADFDVGRRMLLAVENDRKFYDAFCEEAREKPKASSLRLTVHGAVRSLDYGAFSELSNDQAVRRTLEEMIVRYLLDQWNLPAPRRDGDAFREYPTICLFDEKEVCSTCEGKGTIDETLGGGEPAYCRRDAPCPDCRTSVPFTKLIDGEIGQIDRFNVITTPALDTIMNNTAAIEITTKTLANGVDISTLSDAQVYDLIAGQEKEIERLEAIKTKPKKLVAEIEKRQAGIAALVAYLDSKE